MLPFGLQTLWGSVLSEVGVSLALEFLNKADTWVSLPTGGEEPLPLGSLIDLSRVDISLPAVF